MQKKTCGMCKQLLPLDCFAKSKKGLFHRQGHCRKCRKEYDRQHYQRYKETHRKKRTKWEAAVRQIILEAKSKPCADCGVQYHPLIMEFDHREGEEKAFTLGEWMALKYGVEKVATEIAKCDVVCPTCHRIRTMIRLGKITREEALLFGGVEETEVVIITCRRSSGVERFIGNEKGLGSNPNGGSRKSAAPTAH